MENEKVSALFAIVIRLSGSGFFAEYSESVPEEWFFAQFLSFVQTDERNLSPVHAAVTGVFLAELAQGTFYRIRTCYSDAVAVPEGFDVHYILDAVTSREVAAEQRGEDVAVTESEKGAAGTEGPVDDIPYAGLVECLEN
jgi:hypothetical protein